MKKHFLLFLCSAVCMLSCNSKYYFLEGNPKGAPLPFDDYSYIDINATYKLYIRVVYIDKNSDGYFRLDNSNPAPTNISRPIGEVEYLLLSNDNKNVIYITTIRDKYKNYYSNNWLGDEYLNAYDFNKFYPGKWDPDKSVMNFITTDNKQSVNWIISFPDRETLSIDKRESYTITQSGTSFKDSASIKQLLRSAITFREVKHPFSIVFKKKCQASGIAQLPTLKYGKIYFKSCGGSNPQYGTYFRFNRNPDSQAPIDSVVKFKSDRLEFSPARLFGNPAH